MSAVAVSCGLLALIAALAPLCERQRVTLDGVQR